MLRPLAAALCLLALPACDSGSGGAQLVFEEEALLSAISGFTRTTASGAVESRDANDWRIGPAYIGSVSVLQLPFPNPVSASAGTGDVSLDLNLTGGLRGPLTVSVLFDDPLRDTPRFVDLASCASPSLCTFKLSARAIRDGGGGTGLRRIVVSDNDGIVTYGDVQVNG